MNALEKLRQRALDAKSEALLVWRDGNFLIEWYADDTARQPIELMSCTKSIVSLCIGILLDEGTLTSLDQPVAHFYPEWKQGRKARITVRHLLNHTSGLQNVPITSAEIYPSPDFVQLALAAELGAEPGTRFGYNNKAVNLLAGIVERASGRPMDELCADRLFAPMNILDHFWQRDQAGNPHAMAGLKLTPRDFLKFGRLILDQGIYAGRQLVSAHYLREMLAAGQDLNPTCGLLWWRLARDSVYRIDAERLDLLLKEGVDAAFIERIKPLCSVEYAGRHAYYAALEAALGANWPDQLSAQIGSLGLSLSTVRLSTIYGFMAAGYLGQYLLIFPDEKVVVVRMTRREDSGEFDDLIGLCDGLLAEHTKQPAS